MPYWRHAAIAGAAILVILVVKLFDRVNRRYGLGAQLHEFLGDRLASAVLRLAFVAVVGLAAWGAQFLGFVVPDQVEQFIPSEMTAIIGALLAASAFGTGRKSAKTEAASDEVSLEGDV